MTTEEKVLYKMPEEAYSTDPDADGSSYRWVPAEEISFPKTNQVPVRTMYMTGRGYPTPSLPGPDGGEFAYKMPLFGHTVSGGATESPPVTLNLLEEMFQHILGGVRTQVGAALASVDADELGITANAYNVQDVVPVFQAGVPADSPRTQWAHIVSETGGTPNLYGLEPDFEETPTTAAVVRAARAFQFNFAGGGPTDAYYYVDDDGAFTYLGCRAVSATIEEDPQLRAMLTVTVQYDRRVAGVKASIPDPGSAPPVPAIIGAGAPVYFNGTLVETKSIRFDFGVNATPIASRTGANGRAGHDVVSVRPKLTLDPLGDDDYKVLMGEATNGPMLLQFGAGVLDGTVLNSVCFFFPAAQIHEISDADDSGRKRASIVIEMVDEVMFAAGVASRAFQVLVA